MTNDFPERIPPSKMIGYKVRWALSGLHVESTEKSVMVAFQAEGGLIAVEAQYRYRAKRSRRDKKPERRCPAVWRRVA